MKKYIFIALFVAILSLLISAPRLITLYINKNYTDYHIDNCSLSINKITLNNLHINSKSKSGLINKAEITWNKTIILYGGELKVSLSDNQKLSKFKVKGDLDKIYINNSYSNIELNNVNIQQDKICSKNGKVNINYNNSNYNFDIYNSCYEKQNRVISINKLYSEYKDISLYDVVLNKDFPFENIKISKMQMEHLYASSIIISSIDVKNSKINLIINDGIKLVHPVIGPPIETNNVNVELFVNTLNGRITKNGTNAFILFDYKNKSIKGDAECDEWVKFIPDNLKQSNPLGDVKFSGKLLFDLSFDKSNPKFDVKNTCKSTCNSEYLNALKNSFEYNAYYTDGIKKRITGPSTKDWIRLNFISPNMIAALISLEDPAFYSHKGIIAQAFQNSLIANLKQDKFVRGGSTITMQTAKNLYLTRDKNLSRKLQEVFLSFVLESCLSKDQILETYLNIVEFGPNLYGISNASEFYFKKHPVILNPVESFYLASILPKPKSARMPDEKVILEIEKIISKLTLSNTTSDLLLDDFSEVNATFQ